MAHGLDWEQAAVDSWAQHWDRDRGAVQRLTGLTWCCWVHVMPFDALMLLVCGRGGQQGWKTCGRSFSSQSLAEMEPALGQDSAAEQDLQHTWLSIAAAGGPQGLALVCERHTMCLSQLTHPRRAGRRGLTHSPRSSVLAEDDATLSSSPPAVFPLPLRCLSEV